MSLRTFVYWGPVFTLLIGIFLGPSPGWAQLQIAPNTDVTGSGSLSLGYSAEDGSSGNSHGLGVTGQATIDGSYYNPRFIHFQVAPYYARSQSNSDSASITNASGISSTVTVFSATRFPGTITYYRDTNKSSTYGIPNLAGLQEHGSDHGFNLEWGANLEGFPTLEAIFSDGSSDNSVFGSQGGSSSNTKSLILNSRYHFWGFRALGTVSHSSNTDHVDEAFVTGNLILDSHATSTNYNLSLERAIPLGGDVNLRWTHANYGNGNSQQAQNTNGSFTTYDGSLTVRPEQRLTLSASAEYTTNVLGGLEQQIVNATGHTVVLNGATGSGTREDGRAFYSISNGLFVSGYVTHATQSTDGETFALTNYGANVSYHFSKLWLNGLAVSVGMVDGATQEGNSGGGLVGSVNYSKRFRGWRASGDFDYSQDVETLGQFVTTSSMGYGINLQHKISRMSQFVFNFNGGHSGIAQLPGYLSHNESYTGVYITKLFNISGSYAKSYGQSLVTPTGLINLPGNVTPPLISPTDLVAFKGTSYGYGIGTSLFKKLSMTANYSKSNGSTTGQAVDALFNSTSVTIQMSYRFRKLWGNAGYSRLLQNTVGTMNTNSMLNSYFIGISRWFNIF